LIHQTALALPNSVIFAHTGSRQIGKFLVAGTAEEIFQLKKLYRAISVLNLRKAEQSDWALVQGVTSSVMAVSIAAFYARVKVVNVEVGLRTFDIWQHFPEEINPKISGVTADS